MLNIASLQQLRQHSVSVRVTHLPAQVIIELKIYRSLLFFLHAIVYSFSHLSLSLSLSLSVSLFLSLSLSPPVSPSPSLAVRQAGKNKTKKHDFYQQQKDSPALSRFVAGTADSVTERQTDKQTNRQADRQAGRRQQTDRQTCRQADRQTDYQLAAMTHLHSPGLWQVPRTA